MRCPICKGAEMDCDVRTQTDRCPSCHTTITFATSARLQKRMADRDIQRYYHNTDMMTVNVNIEQALADLQDFKFADVRQALEVAQSITSRYKE